jgi:hypothetical protein
VDDTNSAVMPPPTAVSARIVPSSSAEAPWLTLDVAATRVSSEPGHSRYELTLPGPRLPIVAIEPKVQASYVFRQALVSESRLTNMGLAPARLGSGLLRLVVRDQLMASSMDVPIAQPIEPQLALDRRRRQSTARRDARRRAVRRAALDLIRESGGPITARWGDPRLRAPRYDLEAARPSIAIERVPIGQWACYARSFRPSRRRADTDTNTGAAIEADRFRFSRAIPQGDLGLIAVPLDAASCRTAPAFARRSPTSASRTRTDVRCRMAEQREVAQPRVAARAAQRRRSTMRRRRRAQLLSRPRAADNLAP